MTIFEKICRAFIEGNFCLKVIKKIDWMLSKVAKLCFFTFAKSPIQTNKVIFMNYQNDFACNPKYIALEIIRQNLPLDLIWVVRDPKKVADHFPPEIRLVKRNSYLFMKEVISSHIWVDNSINFFWEDIPKRKGQILISTWHGSMGLKRAGKDDNKNKKWVSKAKRCARDTDVCISNSKFETMVYSSTHWFNVPVLEYGHPRNDILFSDNSIQKKIRKKILEKYSLPENAKLVLYAPTFRDSGTIDCYKIDYERLVDALTTKWGGDWYVLMRHHFHLRSNEFARASISGKDRVINVTSYLDMQELLVSADVAITDYSSWICDFVLTKKPGFIFATDQDEYNNERGLYYPLQETPFPVSANNDELVEAILTFHQDIYEKKRQKFLLERGSVEDGNASYRTVEYIKKLVQI